MNDFDDVQEKAQEMTSGVTDGSPAHTIEPASYAGYGERPAPKTKTSGGTTIVNSKKDAQFAVPYTGGGSYPGQVIYGAELNPDNTVVGLKNKYTPVEPYDVQMAGMSGKIDTLNLKKGFAELILGHIPRGIDTGKWYGYDMPIEPAHENFVEGVGRGILNLPGQLVGTAKAAPGWIHASAVTAYGELTDDKNAISLGNDMLEAVRDKTNNFLSQTTFSYGEMGDNSGQNKSGLILGSLLGSMPMSLLTPLGGAATFSGFEALSNAYEARYAAYDRGVSGIKGLGIALAAGTGTAALGVSARFIEEPVKGLFKPSMGWARALKENPKLFKKQSMKANFVVATYDDITEVGQDLLTSSLGNGELTAEDWEQAWKTFVFGGAVASMTTAVKTRADKKIQQQKNDAIERFFATNKDMLERIKAESNGAITQETIDTYFEFLKDSNTQEGFVTYLKNKMAENMDRYDSMPDEFKQRIEAIIKNGDGATPLAQEMVALDNNIDNALNNVENLGDISKETARQFIRGIALYEYMYRGVNPSEFQLPTIVADRDAYNKENPYMNQETGEIHLQKASDIDAYPQQQAMKDTSALSGKNSRISGEVKNQAISIASYSENASFNTPRAMGLTAHELTHWMERKTGLPKVADFMRRMTAWAENVLPGITTGKAEGSIERSEAYAYAVQYAKTLKSLLGLSGDMRQYIELFNAVSSANQAAQTFENYNKVLSQEIKRNASTLDDLLSSYGEDKLRDIIKQYAETGNLGLLKQEDIKRLFEVMESVVDAKTIEKMQTAFGDKATANSFIERYEAEYDAMQNTNDARMERAKDFVKAKQQIHSASMTQKSSELQKYVADTVTVGEEAVSKTEIAEQPTTENVSPEGQETPPYVQYTGEAQPLVRPKEEANWIERFLSGEKIPVDVYNKLLEKYTVMAQRMVGILPSTGTRNFIRQNFSSNKVEGVMTSVWAPTGAELEAMGIPAGAINMLSSDQLAAVGRWRALQDVDAVYSVADDIADITGGGNNNAFTDMVSLKELLQDENTIELVEEAEDIVNALQDFSDSLTHPGTKLNSTDAAYEKSLIERAIALKTFDESSIKNELTGVAVAVKKFVDGINMNALSERYDYLAKQAGESSLDKDPLFLPKQADFKKDTSSPWGVWNQYGAKKRPLTTVLNYALRDENVYDVSYWINRMGLDVDKYPSVDAIEGMIRQKGVRPIDFSDITVNMGGKTVPLFESREAQAAEFGKIYGHQGANLPINVDFNIKALRHVLGGRPTKDKLVEYLLKRVKDQLNPDTLHLSLEEKLQEVAALGRAKMIADKVFAERNDAMAKFSQWATLTQKGNVGVGADVANLARDTKQQNFEKLQEQEIAAGRDAYISRKDLNTNKLPAGLQIAFLYSGSWKQGVITATNMQTDDGNPFYVIRVLNDGEKGTYDLIWDAREFELLQNTPMGKYESALLAKPFKMTRDAFLKVVSEEYWKENYKVDPKDELEGSQYNFTAIAADAKGRKRLIPMRLGFSAEFVDKMAADIMSDEGALYSISGDEFMNDDPFPGLSDEEFENLDREIRESDERYRQLTITGQEKTNQEVYEKMRMAEEARRQPVTRYLERNVPGFGKNVVGTLNELISSIKDRKIRPTLFWVSGGSGPQARTEMLFGDKVANKFGFNLTADRAERVAEDFKKDVERTLLEKTFKNQKELGEWQVRIGVDLDGVKAKMSDGFERPISRDEIMSLYLAELSKDGKNEEFKLPYMYGGTIEENGYTYVYNKLRSTYTNYDELLGHLTKQDQDAAKILFRFLPVLRGVDMNDQTSWFGKFIPVNVFSDYTQDGGWGNRRGHNVAVFGTRLLNPDSSLVAVGLYNSAMGMAGAAGLRMYNYKQSVQFLTDMLNLSALTNDDVRYSRGFRMDLDDNESAQLNEAVKLSEELKQLISDKVGANNFKAYMNALYDVFAKNDGSVATTKMGELFQKVTRTASAMALSLKPRQIFTNLTGNYMVMGGLSSHGALWYNTVGLSNAVAHATEAWNDMKKNGTFMHRLQQAALSEQYRRAADMKADSILQDIEKIAFEKGKEGVGNTLATADALAKVMTKYSIGVTNTLPDMIGLALGRWTVLEDVKANIAAQAAAEGKKMSSEEIATAAENQIADFMFSHISSSNVMARGAWSKGLARRGFEGVVAFKNDQLQKTAALANAWTRLMNSKDDVVRRQSWREIEGIVASNMMYVAIQAGLIRALWRTISGDDMSDEEEKYLVQSLTREGLAQIADAVNGGSFTQPVLEAIFLGKEGGFDFLPFTDIYRLARNARKGDYAMVGGTVAGLAGFSPAERAVQITRALSMAFGDDERAAAVGRLMLAGRSESTAKNMLGYTTNKAGKIVPKKSNKKKD